MTFSKAWLFAALGLFVLPVIGGCDRGSDTESATSKKAEKKEKKAEKKDEKPSKVVFAFQPQENPEALAPDADRLAKYMAEQIGIDAEVFLPTSYAAVVEALRSENADVAYFSGWPYLIASRKADVDLLVVEERKGNPFYHSQWYVAADSDIETVADLKGKSVSFTSPTSTSGYLFPLAKVIEESSMETGDDPKKFFSNIIYAGGYQQSLQALVHDRVDAAAASDYAYEQYLTDEERENMRILSKQGPVPTHGIAVRSALPDDVKEKIKAAFLNLNKSEHTELLKSIYGAEKLVERTHEEHVAALEKALKLVGAEKDLEGFGAGSGSGHGSGDQHHEEGADEGSGEHHGSGEEHGSGEDHGSGEEHGSGEGAGSGEHAGSGE